MAHHLPVRITSRMSLSRQDMSQPDRENGGGGRMFAQYWHVEMFSHGHATTVPEMDMPDSHTSSRIEWHGSQYQKECVKSQNFYREAFLLVSFNTLSAYLSEALPPRWSPRPARCILHRLYQRMLISLGSTQVGSRRRLADICRPWFHRYNAVYQSVALHEMCIRPTPGIPEWNRPAGRRWSPIPRIACSVRS